jgi:hypothetical protein
MYGYKQTDIPGVCGPVGELAYGWNCPPGVAFSWEAAREGDRLHTASSKAWLSHIKPSAPTAPMSQATAGFEF